MSVDDPAGPGASLGNLPDADTEQRRGPRPVAHGSSVQTVFNDLDLDLAFTADGVDSDRDTSIYDAFLAYWREAVGDRDFEPYPVATLDPDRVEWLPPARDGREYVLELTSSRWKAGTGTGDDYRPYYDYHLRLRELDDDGETHKPPLACHLEIMPQYADLNYKDGNPLETPYGEGTRVVTWTTWAESGEEVETRTLDVLEAVLGADRDRLRLARNDDSRRIAKAEAHVRFSIDKKGAVVETLEQTKQLIAYGGETELESYQKRQQEGYLEARVDADRWHLLGFPETPYDMELKVYQAKQWAEKNRDEYAHHPKLEASFAGVRGNGALPHVDEWDDTLQTLREVVSTHLDWAAVGREDLVEDDYFDGPRVDEYQYAFPTNRREQLRLRYENVATDLYREATKANTRAVYDILRVLAEERGATYDTLEARTGLARSSVRRHVRRLDDRGVVDRVGNPVLVVFPNLEVLDEASEILRQVFAGDSIDDMNERAEERRERRERGDYDRTPDPAPDDRDDDASSSRADWRYFRDVPIEPHQLANALERDYLDDDEVRVRVDRWEWLTG